MKAATTYRVATLFTSLTMKRTGLQCTPERQKKDMTTQSRQIIGISPMKEAVSALGSPSPCHNRLAFLRPLLYRVFPSHKPSTDSAFQADSLFRPPNLSNAPTSPLLRGYVIIRFVIVTQSLKEK